MHAMHGDARHIETGEVRGSSSPHRNHCNERTFMLQGAKSLSATLSPGIKYPCLPLRVSRRVPKILFCRSLFLCSQSFPLCLPSRLIGARHLLASSNVPSVLTTFATARSESVSAGLTWMRTTIDAAWAGTQLPALLR